MLQRCRQHLLRAVRLEDFYTADLGSVQPVSGFTKSQVAAARRRASVVGITASSNTETAVQPVQQDSQAPKPGHYKCNSFAIKLASNPVTSLAGLQDAVAAVLDAPVSVTLCHTLCVTCAGLCIHIMATKL